MATGFDPSTGFCAFNYTPIKAAKNNVLECRVCEDVFSLHGEKVPRLLLCGHTLCHQCLMKLIHNQNAILCPFDRQPTPIYESGVWGLKKNFALLELLERLQCTDQKPSILSADLLDAEKEFAIPCDEDENHAATLYCIVCSTNLCSECSESTHATKTLCKHKRVPLSEKPREKPKCVYHPEHSVEFACIEDECQASPLMCFVCKDYGRHQKHRHSLIELEAENIKQTVGNAVQHMRLFLEDVSESIQKICHLIQQIEGHPHATNDDHGNMEQQWVMGSGEEARIRVTSYFNDLRETLRRQEVAALTVVDTHIRERVCSLRQQQEDINSLQIQVSSICLQCEKALRQDDARVLLASRELKALLETVQGQQQQYTELPFTNVHDCCIPITFTKDNRVHIGPKIEMRVVTLGLDDAGKTSILYKLKQNEFMPTIPTIGFNVETVECKNLKFTIWDVGGQAKLRPLWRHYYLNTQAVIFVVDSSSRTRLEEAYNELTKLLSEKELKEASLLVFANKQDLPGCLTIEDITDALGLYKLCCGRSWHIQACDAQSGTGLFDGLDWLARQLIAAGVTGIA